jgi:hypothetical protein
MRKKLYSILIVLVMVSSVFLFLIPVLAKPTTNIVYEPMDIGNKIRNQVVDFTKELDKKGTSFGLKASTEDFVVGNVSTWLWYDDTMGLYLADYELYSLGNKCELWVMTDLSWGVAGDRATPVITHEQADYMVEQFDTVIYPEDTTYFGVEDFHNGSYAALPFGYYDETGRTVILVSNIGDENYWDPEYPYYIAGFYWGSVFEYYCDRNVMSIDAYAWEFRTGPQDPPDPEGRSRPYLYEGVFAHEFQHLIHDDYFLYKADATFMNEGCSMFAEILCGYSSPFSQINSFFATPDNSLTIWGDQENPSEGYSNILADYGQAFLWATYLVDTVDPDFLKDYIAAGADYEVMVTNDIYPGIELLDYKLAPFGKDYEGVFKEWTLANLLQEGYTSFDWDNEEMGDGVRIYQNFDKWPTGVTGSSFGETYTILDFPTGVTLLGEYGTDYIQLNKLKKRLNSMFYFDGQDSVDLPMWVEQDMNGDGDLEWFTGVVPDEGDVSIVAEVDLGTASSAVLSFDTYYAIELDGAGAWDFGFVQVSTDSGYTWTSLEGTNTIYDTADGAYPDIIANLPGFSGFYEGIMEFDLGGYLVDDLQIRFRYMTDWVYQEFGWWVDNVEVTTDSETIAVTEFGPAFAEVDFSVHLVRVDKWRGKTYYSLIAEMELDDENTGEMWLAPFLFFRSPEVIVVVSADTRGVDYEFTVDRECFCKHWKHFLLF